MSLTLAHAGHWLVQLLYVAPLLFLGAAMAVASWRRRRAERDRSRESAR